MKLYFDDYDEKTDEMSISDLRGDRVNETNGNYVAIDIETTGFAYRDDILEIAAVKVKDNSIVDTFQTLIKPTEPIPVNITVLTGIDDEMVKDAPAFDDVIESFITFIGNDTILGHNVIFDLDRLNNKLYNKNMQTINNCYIDTMYMSKDRIPSLDSYNLIGVANHLNVKIDVSHRALSDCYTTISCYNILKSMPETFLHKEVHGNNQTAYQFLNRVPIPYNDPDHKVSAQGIVYYLIDKPYYASNGLFYSIMSKHGAEEFDSDYYDEYTFPVSTIKELLNKVTHIIVGEKRYETIEFEKDFLEAIKEHNITILSEMEMYKLLDIDTSSFPEIKKKNGNHLSQKDVVADNTDFNEDHPLFGKTVVITGSLNGMSRKDAYLKIKNVGGLCGDSITKKTDYLVTNSTAKTGKMKKALQYIDEGFDIKIINEQDLYDLLGL